MLAAQQDSRKLREQVGILKAEKEALIKSEKRLVDDISSLRQEVAHNQSLAQNLQKFLAARDASEESLKRSTSEEITRLRTDLQQLRKTKEDEENQMRDKLRAAELSVAEVNYSWFSHHEQSCSDNLYVIAHPKAW